MKPKIIVKIGIDINMTMILLLLMSYSLIGTQAHEWLGIGMFVLLTTHHILNLNWLKRLSRCDFQSIGKYFYLSERTATLKSIM